MGNGEWGMGNGEWGKGALSQPHCLLPTPHSPDYDSAALVFAARLTLFLASGFFATASSPLTVL
jgi:hypothetical protein